MCQLVISLIFLIKKKEKLEEKEIIFYWGNLKDTLEYVSTCD